MGNAFKKCETHQHKSARLLQTGIRQHTRIGTFPAGYCKLHCCHIDPVALNTHQYLEYYNKDSCYYKNAFKTDARKKENVQVLNNSRLVYLIHILDSLHPLKVISNRKISFQLTVTSANLHKNKQTNKEKPQERFYRGVGQETREGGEAFGKEGAG